MSTIHEALRKAQKDKDRVYKEAGLGLYSRERTTAFHEKILWIGLLAVMMILLAFVCYSWLDSANPDVATRSKIRLSAPPAAPPPLLEAETASTYYKRAKAFQAAGDWANAKANYLAVLRIDPGHVDTLNNLGVIHLKEGDFAAAQDHFEKAIHLRNDYVEPHYNLACLHSIRGEKLKGLYHLGKAVSLNPSAAQWAQEDADLKKLRETEDFEEIISKKGSENP